MLGNDDRERRRTVAQAASDLRHEAYLNRQEAAVQRLERARHRRIPASFDFTIPGLSSEVQERLTRARPETLEQAGRLPGITPAALQVLDAYLERAGRESGTGGAGETAVPRGTGS